MNSKDFLTDLFSLTGKVAVVTGGANGIGRMIAAALSLSGARVIVSSRKEAASYSAATEINALGGPENVEPIVGDVGTEEGVISLARRIGEKTDQVDILVNNAGKTWGAPLESFPYDAWNSVMAVNVTGPFALTQHLLPLLKRRATASDPSRIVNIGSMVGLQPVAENAYSYAASKAALHHLTKLLSLKLAESFITVNAIAPGVFESRMTAFVANDPTRRAATTAAIPLARFGTATDIAGPLLLLCGRAGSYITGAVLPVDGGLAVLPPRTIFG